MIFVVDWPLLQFYARFGSRGSWHWSGAACWARVPRGGWGLGLRLFTQPMFSERCGSRLVRRAGPVAVEVYRPIEGGQ